MAGVLNPAISISMFVERALFCLNRWKEMSEYQKRGRIIDNVSMFMLRTFDWNFLMPSSICEFNCTQHYKVQILFKNVLSFFTFSGRFVCSRAKLSNGSEVKELMTNILLHKIIFSPFPNKNLAEIIFNPMII